MHVKFLVPEIDRKKWSEDFKRYVDTRGFTINDLSNISAEPNSAQIINKIKHNGTIPTLDRFLAICRFFVWTPDRFLTPIPKWVECEVDDISCFNIAGKIGDTYYVTPSYSKDKPNEIKELSKEPDPSDFSRFSMPGTKYFKDEIVNKKKGTYNYRFPIVNDEKTKERINGLLEKYHLKDMEKLRCIFEYKTIESSRRLLKIKNGQNWDLKNVYKLSWIFNKPIEELLVIEYQEATCESVFSIETYLEFYEPDPNEVWNIADEYTGKDHASIRLLQKYTNRNK